MGHRLRHLRRDERGMSLVFVGFGFLGLFAATTLAIDVGMLMTARSQAQNSADAGALAGATALYFNSFTNRTATGPAVESAINAAQGNNVIGAAPSVVPADVTFPNDPAGQPTEVQVVVQRSSARGNPVPTIIARLFGRSTVDIAATATAQAAPANAETCVKPFTIPDRWLEEQTPPVPHEALPTDTFDMYDSKGKLLPNPDVYIPRSQSNYTGYQPNRDKGMELVLKQNNTGKVAPSMYNPWDLPGSMGSSDYRNNIEDCNQNVIPVGQNMPPQNGNQVGPTVQGTSALIAKDPGATWDTTCNCVVNSAFGVSPRVAIIPLYDPVAYAQGQAQGKNATLNVVDYIGFFIEQVSGGDVYGRILPVTGLYDGNAGPANPGAFTAIIRLVK